MNEVKIVEKGIEKVKGVVEANNDVVESYEVRRSYYIDDEIVLEVVLKTTVSAIRVNSEFLYYVDDELAEIIDRYNYLASYEVTYSSENADEIIKEFLRDVQIVRTLNDKEKRREIVNELYKKHATDVLKRYANNYALDIDEDRVHRTVVRNNIEYKHYVINRYLADIHRVIADVAFDVTKPRYSRSPAHVNNSRSELIKEFREKFRRAHELYNEALKMKRLVDVTYAVYHNKKLQKHVSHDYYKDVAKKLKSIGVDEVQKRLEELTKIDKEIRKLNRELKELSSKIYAERQKEIEEGVRAFEEGRFETAWKLLSEKKFKELLKSEFDVQGYVADVSDKWRAVVVLETEFDNGRGKIVPTGWVNLCYSDDNGESGVIRFYDEIVDGYIYEDPFNYTIEDAEAFIFNIKEETLMNYYVARQGDVLIIRADDNIQLDDEELGEATELAIRESHVLKSNKAFKYFDFSNDEQGKYYVELSADAVLEHNSHRAVKLKAGKYIIVTTRRIENAYD